MNSFLGKLMHLLGIVYEEEPKEGSYMEENPQEYTRGTAQVPPRRQAQVGRQNTYIPEYNGSASRRTSAQPGRGNDAMGSFRGSRYDEGGFSERTNSYKTNSEEYEPYDPRKSSRNAGRTAGSRFGNVRQGNERFGSAQGQGYDEAENRELRTSDDRTRGRAMQNTEKRGATRPAARYNYEERVPGSERDMSASSPYRERSYEGRTVMLELTTLEDCCDIIDQLVVHNTVVLSMDTGDAAMERRVLDTLAGAAFALGGNIRRASSNTYLLVPEAQNGYGL